MSPSASLSRSLRVQVCLDLALDREAYGARINVEPGFTVVNGSSLANPPDLRLASRCRNDLGEPAIPTVVLIPTPTSKRPCECCLAIPRTVNWPALMQALRKAVGRDVTERFGGGVLSALTRRELEVLRLVGLGKSVNQCADALGVTPSTIGNHKYRLMRKLGATTSLQLLRIAVRNGLTDLDAAPDLHPVGGANHLGGGALGR